MRYPGFFVGIGTSALINAGLAETKNRSRIAWFSISLVLGSVATLLIVVLDRTPAPTNSRSR